jgi:hypothetical protein
VNRYLKKTKRHSAAFRRFKGEGWRIESLDGQKIFARPADLSSKEYHSIIGITPMATSDTSLEDSSTHGNVVALMVALLDLWDVQSEMCEFESSIFNCRL